MVKIWIPCEAEVRRRLFEVTAIARRTKLQLRIEVAVQHARLKQPGRWSEQIGDRGAIEIVVRVHQCCRELPPETEVQGEGRRNLPSILEVQTSDGLLLLDAGDSTWLVPPACGIERNEARNRSHAASPSGI